MESHPSVAEKKMFDGLIFMLQGHMYCGVLKENLVIRLGPDGAEEALTEPHPRPMPFTGKPMKGTVYVSAKGCESDDALQG